MDRRSFIKTTVLGGLATGFTGFIEKEKTHILTLSFDDGFKRSFYKTAYIYEQYGLKACFNVIASGHLPDFKQPDPYILPSQMGNFDDWNALKKRGHEVMMHTWDHTNLTQLPFDQATSLIDKCISYFKEHLEGFDATQSVYNFAFNASTPELEKYALSKVRAVRTDGNMINPIPKSKQPVRLGCGSNGPANIDKYVEEQVNKFLASSGGGWLMLNTHGLDDEGWGPMSSSYLSELLQRLKKIDYLEMLSTGVVMKRIIP